MKTAALHLYLLPALILASCQVVFAQEHPTSVDTMLRDSAYVFNRYEEATTGLDAEVDGWKISDSTKQSIKDTTRKVRRLIELEKTELNSLLGRKKVPTTALFDVHEELIMVTDDLDGISTNYLIFWENNKAVALDMAKLRAKARDLSTDMGIVLRSQIADQEDQLAACSKLLKSPARK